MFFQYYSKIYSNIYYVFIRITDCAPLGTYRLNPCPTNDFCEYSYANI